MPSRDTVRLISPTDDVIDPLQDALGYEDDDDELILKDEQELERPNWYVQFVIQVKYYILAAFSIYNRTICIGRRVNNTVFPKLEMTSKRAYDSTVQEILL